MQRFFVYPEWLDSRNPKDKIEVVKCADHEQALAEKDQEIQQIREHEFQRGYREGEAIWEEKYKQLMAQTVWFAEWIHCDLLERYDGDRAKAERLHLVFSQIVQFFRSPEAQAFLKEHNGEVSDATI